MGNHELYLRRRRSDTIEIQQMKAQAREERAKKQAECARLAQEKEARLSAERQRSELQDRVKQFEAEAKRAMEALARSEALAKELEEKVQKAEAEAAERERLRLEAERLKRQAEINIESLQSSHSASEEEKQQILKRTKEAEMRAKLLAEEAANREREAQELQSALIEAKRQQIEDAKALVTATSTENFDQVINVQGATAGDTDVDATSHNPENVLPESPKQRGANFAMRNGLSPLTPPSWNREANAEKSERIKQQLAVMVFKVSMCIAVYHVYYYCYSYIIHESCFAS